MNLVLKWFKTDSLTRRIGVEGAIFALIYFAYRFGQGLVSDQYEKAERNANWIINVEKDWGLYFELSWQRFFMDTDLFIEVINWYYENMHFPVTLLALVWVFLHFHEKYGVVRNFWLLFTLGAFVVQWLVPMMPPRLMPELGFIDISSTRPGGIYSEDELGPLTNQIAAMPSVHFGWSMVAAMSVVYVRRHWTSWLAFIHPAFTFLAIVATANHWVLDAVFALPLLGAAFMLAKLDLHHKAREAVGLPEFSRSMPAVDPAPFEKIERSVANFRGMALVSLAIFLAALAYFWDWYDVDEFANLQQALGVVAGNTLYVDLVSHHPPLYVVPFLVFAEGLPGDTLLWARLGSTFMAWGAGVLAAHMFWRREKKRTAGVFLALWTTNVFVLMAGTRAMNEVPVLFFVIAAAWLYTSERSDRFAGIATGILLALSFMTRYTTVFFAIPFLFTHRHRLKFAIPAGILTLAAIILAMWAINPKLVGAFLDESVFYQTGRISMGKVFNLGQVFLGAGGLVLAAAWRFVPELRPKQNAWMKLAAITFLGCFLMGLLPRVYVHYFLPVSPMFIAVASAALMKKGLSGIAKQTIIGAVLLTGILIGGIYSASTPHSDLNDAKEISAWVAEHTPEDLPIISDAPEYAILSNRDNWDFYFWNLRDDYTVEEMNQTLSEVSVVVVSDLQRFKDTYPTGFISGLDLPCASVGTADIYWTGTAGEAPEMNGC